MSDYSLIDSGYGRKLERIGPYLLARPCAVAAWKPQQSLEHWEKADGSFSRENSNKWTYRTPLPSSWNIQIDSLKFKISLTEFGHLGIFPEQRALWKWIDTHLQQGLQCGLSLRVLNLFAYSGGATIAAAKAGAKVCHLDASKAIVSWARENALLNDLQNAPIRWIIEDVKKFLKRELQRASRYDVIILDPPTFGRGSKGEVFKIEEDILDLLQTCRLLLSDTPLFILFSSHTPGFSPIVMQHLLTQTMEGKKGKIESGEMLLISDDKTVLPVPQGTYARWIGELLHVNDY